MFPGPDDDPFASFAAWLAEAESSEPNDPNAMALATVDADGQPSVRMVLLKGADPSGFVFYTNLGSRKGRDLKGNPKAALLFHWKSRRRQVRVEGAVAPVGDDEADAYFASRARQSQIGAWASDQSAPLADRFGLEKAVAREAARFGLGKVPRPPHWSGFRLVPRRFEFWADGKFRLHDRAQYIPAGDGWSYTRLYP